jgi:tetratricopeptide (TPR) repeat protein
MGRRDLALQLCLRGLEHHPTHVEAHALLALLYFEAGERAKAADEWATVLRLKPGNFEALRGMGFRHLEQGDTLKARQHLERAALIRPDDATVQEALRLIRHRESLPAAKAEATPPRAHSPRPKPAPPPSRPPGAPGQHVASSQHQHQATPPPTAPTQRQPTPQPQPPRQTTQRTQPRFEPAWTPEPDPTPSSPVSHARRAPGPMPSVPPPDPTKLFESIMGTGPLLGVLLLDRRGLVLAGGLSGRDASTAEELGANLGGAIDEAVRAVTHLELGVWRGLTVESKNAVLQIRPVGGEALVVVVAERAAPAGWVVRAADHAAALADRFVEVYS